MKTDTDKREARKPLAQDDVLGRALNAWDAQPRRVRVALAALYCLVMITMIIMIAASCTVIHTVSPGQPTGQ